MKQAKDNHTLELPMPGAKRGRGRPPTFSAMTNAERQKAYRDRIRAEGAPRDAKQARTGKFALDDQEADADRARVAMIEGALSAAQARIERLEKENALLIEERAKAFKVADQAKAELISVSTDTRKTTRDDYVLELETSRKQDWEMIAHYEESAKWNKLQQEGYEAKIKKLEANIKRNASRKKITDKDLVEAIKGK